MFEKVSSFFCACLRYRKTNVSVVLLLTYLSIGTLYLNNPFVNRNNVLPDDPISIELLDNAWLDLQNITYSPHPYTSHDNDRVHGYILNRVNDIIKNNTFCEISDDYENKRSILFKQQDVFNSSSTKTTVVYFESSNILIKIQGKNKHNKEGLLLSAHFDSVPTSHGATDDGKGIVSILALLDYYSKHQPERTIILNLNNNEEFGLLGAYTFFDHPWSNMTKYFINLEGTGTGEGNSIMFRTSNVLTANTYKNAVIDHPFGNSVFQQGFKQGLIHSETDYKVYESNGLLGWDIAFYKPRSLYHTVRDNVQYTSKAALWNMLWTTWQLCDYISTNAIKEDGTSNDPAVFFDVFGYIFFAFSARWLFICNMVLLIVFPLLFVLLKCISRKRNNSKQKLTVAWFSFPISITISAVLVKCSEKFIIQLNPYVASHGFLALVISLSIEFILINSILIRLFKAIFKQIVLKDTIFVELTIISWFLLGLSTVMLQTTNYTSTGVYPVTGLYLSLIGCVFIQEVISLFKPRERSSDIYKEISPSRTNEDLPGSNSSVYGSMNENAVVLTDDDEHRVSSNDTQNNVDERAPLLSTSVNMNSHDLVEISNGEEVQIRKLKHYEWLLQFIILVPITIVLFQVTIDSLSGLNQIIQETVKSFNIVYNTIFVLSIALTIIAMPFISRIRFNLLVSLSIVWLIVTMHCICVESFSWDAPLKVRFVQNINGTVELTGRINSIKDLVVNLPSYKNSGYKLLDNGLRCYGEEIGVCYYEGEKPHLVPKKTNETQFFSIDILNNDRLSEDRSKYAPINANIRINVPDNRACSVFFNSSIGNEEESAVRKLTVFHDNDRRMVKEDQHTIKLIDGINELQLHKLNFTNGNYHIGIQWFPKLLWDEQFKQSDVEYSDDSLGVTIKCYWGEYDTDTVVEGEVFRKIPAYDELLQYAPLNYSFTNKEKGLVIAHKYLEL